MEQIQNGDAVHLEAATKMTDATPEEQQAMFAEYKRKYDEAPEIEYKVIDPTNGGYIHG